jgi:hypothetical protein
VHLLGCADNRIDRTGLNTQRTTDTRAFVDHRDWPLAFKAVHGINRNYRLAKEFGDSGYTLGTTWGALVVARATSSDGLGVGATSGIAALSALRLG